MEDIKNELIEVRNRIDAIIKQLGTEEISISDESLESIIFNPKLFNTPEKVSKLKQTIGSFISNHPTKDEKKIDARTKNQFFYLYAALWSLPDVLADDSMVSFVRQMTMWFPEYLPSAKKTCRKYERSLSYEKQKWEKDGMLLKVMDWKGLINPSSMRESMAKRFESLAMEIFTTLNLLVKEMRRR